MLGARTGQGSDCTIQSNNDINNRMNNYNNHSTDVGLLFHIDSHKSLFLILWLHVVLRLCDVMTTSNHSKVALELIHSATGFNYFCKSSTDRSNLKLSRQTTG